MSWVAARPLLAKQITPDVSKSSLCTGRSSGAWRAPTCAARRLVTEPARSRCLGVTGTPAGLETTTMSESSYTTSSGTSGSASGGRECSAPATTERARRSGQRARAAAARVVMPSPSSPPAKRRQRKLPSSERKPYVASTCARTAI
eukprot:scaffold14363_cov111-Isochrysis_galbana.AAC.3